MKKNITQFKILLFLLFIAVKGISQEFKTIREYHENFSIRSFAFSKSKYFARLSYNNQTIYVESLTEPGKILFVFSKENEGVKYLSFDEKEKYLASASYSGEINIWGIEERKLLKTFRFHEGAVNKVGFIPNTLWMISIGNDGKIMMIKIDEENPIPFLLGSHSGIIRSFDITKDGKYLITVGNDKKVNIWNLETRQKLLESFLFKNILTSVSFINDGEEIVVGDINGNISVLSFKGLKSLNSLKIHENIISQIVSISNNKIITSSYDGYIKGIDLTINKDYTILFNKSYIIQLSIYEINKLGFSDVNGNLKLIQIMN